MRSYYMFINIIIIILFTHSYYIFARGHHRRELEVKLRLFLIIRAVRVEILLLEYSIDRVSYRILEYRLIPDATNLGLM